MSLFNINDCLALPFFLYQQLCSTDCLKTSTTVLAEDELAAVDAPAWHLFHFRRIFSHLKKDTERPRCTKRRFSSEKMMLLFSQAAARHVVSHHEVAAHVAPHTTREVLRCRQLVKLAGRKKKVHLRCERQKDCLSCFCFKFGLT